MNQSEFTDWLNANMGIWVRFMLEANKIWDSGRRHYSARTIVEYMRHETAVRERSGEWKINNNVVPYLARTYMELYPARAGFFALRDADAR